MMNSGEFDDWLPGDGADVLSMDAPPADPAPIEELACHAGPEAWDEELAAAGDPLAAELTVDEPLAFGTFFVGETELAFPTECVREVVPYPEAVTRVPMSGPEVHGIFSLRGEILPIVDLAGVLGLEGEGRRQEGRVAVIEHGSVHLGVALDRTGEVVRTARDQVHRVEHEDAGGRGVIDGVIELQESGRFIQTVSADVLTGITGVPRHTEAAAVESARVEPKVYAKAIVFRVGSVELALPIHDVLEIQSELSISSSPLYFVHCVGVVLLRGNTYPIMDLRAALGCPTEAPPSRYVFVELDGERVGLGVDALVETIEFPEDALLPVPRLLVSDLTSICNHALQPTEGRHVLVMSVAGLFARFEVGKLSGLLGYGAGDQELGLDDSEELGFFAFRIRERTLCLPLEQVREVRQIGPETFSAGPDSGDLYGLMNLRGEVVPLVDGCRRLCLEEDAPDPGDQADDDGPGAVALVVDLGDEAFGLVVDAIVDIKRMRASQVSDAGTALAGGPERGVMSYVRSTLMIQGAAGGEDVMVVLDARRLAQG